MYREEGDSPRSDLLCQGALALLHLEVLPNLQLWAGQTGSLIAPMPAPFISCGNLQI